MITLDVLFQVFNIILLVLGLIVTYVIMRTVNLHRDLKITKTTMTPMLIVGILLSVSALTELLEMQLGETGQIIHYASMIMLSVGFLFGILNYQKMLKKLKKY